MLAISCLLLPSYYPIAILTHPYCRSGSCGHTSYCLTVFAYAYVVFWNSNPQLKNVHTINCIIYPEILVYWLGTHDHQNQVNPRFHVCCSWISRNLLYYAYIHSYSQLVSYTIEFSCNQHVKLKGSIASYIS